MSISSRADADRAIGCCPLCREFEIKSHDQYLSHVGHHLEQLALFVQPSSSDAKEETSASGEAEAGDISTPELAESSQPQNRDLGAEAARDDVGKSAIEDPQSQHDQFPELPQPDHHQIIPGFEPGLINDQPLQKEWRWTCVRNYDPE